MGRIDRESTAIIIDQRVIYRVIGAVRIDRGCGNTRRGAHRRVFSDRIYSEVDIYHRRDRKLVAVRQGDGELLVERSAGRVGYLNGDQVVGSDFEVQKT